jgi:hypothetical protein
MDRETLPLTALTGDLQRGLYLEIIMDREEGPHTALTIVLHRGLWLAIIMDREKGNRLPLLYSCIEALSYPL